MFVCRRLTLRLARNVVRCEGRRLGVETRVGAKCTARCAVGGLRAYSTGKSIGGGGREGRLRGVDLDEIGKRLGGGGGGEGRGEVYGEFEVGRRG